MGSGPTSGAKARTVVRISPPSGIGAPTVVRTDTPIRVARALAKAAPFRPVVVLGPPSKPGHPPRPLTAASWRELWTIQTVWELLRRHPLVAHYYLEHANLFGFGQFTVIQEPNGSLRVTRAPVSSFVRGRGGKLGILTLGSMLPGKPQGASPTTCSRVVDGKRCLYRQMVAEWYPPPICQNPDLPKHELL